MRIQTRRKLVIAVMISIVLNGSLFLVDMLIYRQGREDSFAAQFIGICGLPGAFVATLFASSAHDLAGGILSAGVSVASSLLFYTGLIWLIQVLAARRKQG
jgi:hypothetical protein